MPSLVFPPQTDFDYHRTIVGYHGTRRSTASRLVDGESFGASENDDDWLGHGVWPQPGILRRRPVVSASWIRTTIGQEE